MGSDELARRLRSKQIPQLILLHGQESYLIERAERAVRRAVLENDPDDFNDDRFVGKQADATQIVAAATTLPVFAAKRLVTVREAHLLPVSEQDALLAYLKDPAPETCLLLVADKIDNRRKFFQQCKKVGLVVECKPPSDRELPTYVRTFLAEHDLSITADALILFCAIVGTSLHELFGELEKLRTYLGGRDLIDVADIKAVISRGRGESIFAIGNAVGRRDAGQSLALCRQLLSAGEAPLKILALVVRHFRQLWKIKELQAQNSSQKEIAAGAGVPFFVLNAMLAQVRSYTRQELLHAYELFLETDLAMKSSGADAEALLESLLLRLTLGGEKRSASGPQPLSHRW
jgi:DNA polymerase III subunit delta